MDQPVGIQCRRQLFLPRENRGQRERLSLASWQLLDRDQAVTQVPLCDLDSAVGRTVVEQVRLDSVPGEAAERGVDEALLVVDGEQGDHAHLPSLSSA